MTAQECAILLLRLIELRNQEGTPIPVLVEIDELPEEHRPHSADPDFWDVWTLAKPRVIDWSSVTDEWSRSPEPPAGFDEEPEGDTA